MDDGKKRIVLVGGAGTGKSKRLLTDAYKQSKEGKSSLVIAKTFAMNKYLSKLFELDNIKVDYIQWKYFANEKDTASEVTIENGGPLHIFRIDDLAHYIQTYLGFEAYDEQRGWEYLKNELSKEFGSNVGLTEHCKYDCVYVDEAQDLEKDTIEALEMMAEESITVTYSESQSLFNGDLADLEYLDGRNYERETLCHNYRMTPEICRLATSIQKIIEGDEYKLSEEDEKESINPNRGSKPKLIECESTNDEVDKMIELIKNIDLTKTSVVVLGKLTRQTDDPRSSKSIIERLKQEGIEVIDDQHKEAACMPGLRVTNTAKIKGLEYDEVMLFLDNDTFFGPSRNSADTYSGAKNLYTAITRAKDMVYMFMNRNAQFNGKPSKSYYLYKNIITPDMYERMV